MGYIAPQIKFLCQFHLSFHVGNLAREEMVKSKLPNSVLRRVWALSDIDKDGMLDRDEFAVAMFLIDHKLKGNDIPETLPDRVIPPSKRPKAPSRRAYDSPSTSSYRPEGGYSSRGGGMEDPIHSMPATSRRMNDYDEHDDVGGGLGGYVD